MSTKLKFVTLSFALGLGVWACGGTDENPNGGSSGSGGSAGKTSTAGSHSGGAGAAGAPMDTAGDTAIGGDTGIAGDAAIAGDTSSGGDSGNAGDSSLAGNTSVGGTTAGGGGSNNGGASNTAGASSTAGTGGAAASASCQTTGTVPVCAALNSVQCNMVDGCTDSATPCGGTPTPCESILDQGKCNSTAGCSAAGGNGCQTVGTQALCATHLNASTCTAAGCAYKPCGGTAVACSSLGQAACALHASYCTWQ